VVRDFQCPALLGEVGSSALTSASPLLWSEALPSPAAASRDQAPERVNTLLVGAGRAGLATGYCLIRHGVDHHGLGRRDAMGGVAGPGGFFGAVDRTCGPLQCGF